MIQIMICAMGLQGNDLRFENLEAARQIAKQGEFDVMVLEDDWIQEWKERGRMRPFTAEGIEEAISHAMAVKKTEPQQQNRWAHYWKWAIGIGIAIMGAAALAMML